MHSLLLTAGEEIVRYRKFVRSWLADQSKGSKVGSILASIAQKVSPCMTMSAAKVDEFFFPDCVEIFDHLHILQNALASAVRWLSWWEDFREVLQAFTTVWAESTCGSD